MIDLPTKAFLDCIIYADRFRKYTKGQRKRYSLELEIIKAAENVAAFMALQQDQSLEGIPYVLPEPRTA